MGPTGLEEEPASDRAHEVLAVESKPGQGSGVFSHASDTKTGRSSSLRNEGDSQRERYHIIPPSHGRHGRKQGGVPVHPTTQQCAG